MELLKLCGGVLVDWSLKLNSDMCRVRGLSAVMASERYLQCISYKTTKSTT